MPSVLSDNWRTSTITNNTDQVKRITRPALTASMNNTDQVKAVTKLTVSASMEMTRLGDELDEVSREDAKYLNIYNRLKRGQLKTTNGLKVEFEEYRKEVRKEVSSHLAVDNSRRRSFYTLCPYRRVKGIKIEKNVVKIDRHLHRRSQP